MKPTIILALFIFLSGCTDETSPLQSSQGDSTYPTILLPDANPDSDLDSSVDVNIVRIIDAQPDVDAFIVDAAPPIVCERYGSKEECEIPGLLGPCSVGERTCLSTQWTQCVPVNFPRQEVCDGLDNDCDGVVNESPPELSPQHPILFRSCYTGAPGTSKSGPCRPGISVCEEINLEEEAGTGSIYDYGLCINQVLPSEESCDSIDNDCDSITDEGVLNVCGACGEVPEEVCDGLLDEDCDGLVDEQLLNDCGACGPTPRELCDFLDNDCDGNIDEDFAEEVCACDHPDYVPQPEICNGADEDCDGFIDEGPDGGPLSKLCSTDIATGEILTYDNRADGPQYVAGECRLGAAFCESRRGANNELEYGYYECQQEVRPGIERCNDEDDDCDGNADEDFEQGLVAVMMVVDVSGSMNEQELGAAFQATRDSVQNLFDDGINDVCYMLAIVGNDEMPDPYLFYPADTCVPGIEEPPVAPIEDMSNAVNTLRLNLQAGTINQGGASENTLDAIGRFFTDDLVDWDRDGVNDNILWSTNRPEAAIQGIENSWDVDLSNYTHRIVIILGDELAQGSEWSNHDAARAMAWAGGMVFIIGNRINEFSYQPLIDIGAVHNDGLGGFGNQNSEQIVETIVEAIEEAACINNRQDEPPDEPIEDAAEQQGAFLTRPFMGGYSLASYDFPDMSLNLCY